MDKFTLNLEHLEVTSFETTDPMEPMAYPLMAVPASVRVGPCFTNEFTCESHSHDC